MDDTWPAQAPGSNPTVVHRGKHIERMLREAATGLAYLTLKEPDPHPLSVARASVALARCDAIYRAGPVTALAGALGRQIKRAKSCADLMMSIEEPRLLDIARMHIPLSELLADWSRAAAEGLPYQPNQAFLAGLAVGGADGDLVIGDLLLDLKAREKVTNPWLRGALFQLLGYALLDINDLYGVRRVGIMLPRQIHFQTWSLDELFGANSEEVLPGLREEFTALLREMVDAGLDGMRRARSRRAEVDLSRSQDGSPSSLAVVPLDGPNSRVRQA